MPSQRDSAVAESFMLSEMNTNHCCGRGPSWSVTVNEFLQGQDCAKPTGCTPHSWNETGNNIKSVCIKWLTRLGDGEHASNLLVGRAEQREGRSMEGGALRGIEDMLILVENICNAEEGSTEGSTRPSRCRKVKQDACD